MKHEHLQLDVCYVFFVMADNFYAEISFYHLLVGVTRLCMILTTITLFSL